MSAIPLVYNVESVRERWQSTIVALLGIAGTVAVYVAMLSMARGFQATLAASGSPENAIVRRAGATSELDSVVLLDQVRAIQDAGGVAREGEEALVSPEVVVVAALPLKKDPSVDANVQVRGVSPHVLKVRPGLRMREGRFFESGLAELVVGRNAVGTYVGLGLGSHVVLGGIKWTVVGILDGGGSAFDSEIWCDAGLLNEAYQRPRAVAQSVTVRMASASSLPGLRDQLTRDPRLTVQVDGEVEYYEKASEQLTALITSIGSVVVLVMGVGAIFGALNTMYSAVAERRREVATLRALGFGGGSVVLCFVIESLMIALVGGVLGCLAVLPLNGFTAGTMNWQTFSHLSFAFRITPALLAQGMIFALAMGLAGGVPPAVRAARLPVAEALRGL
jgi:putative ABC transport system permease protein